MFEIAQHDSAEHDLVAVADIGLFDAPAIDKRTVGAAVIEDPMA